MFGDSLKLSPVSNGPGVLWGGQDTSNTANDINPAVRPPGLQTMHQSPDSQDLWSGCPPDMLTRCFNSQQDYTDNSAAACVNRSWRHTFRNCAEQIKIQQNFLNEGSLSSNYLQQFTKLHTAELGLLTSMQHQHSSSWLAAGEISLQVRLKFIARWTQMVQSIPTSCCWLRLDGYLPHRTGLHLGQLSNLQSLYIHSHQVIDVPLEDLTLPQLQLLSLVGRPLASIQVLGSLQNLPTSITNLQLNYCRSMPIHGDGFCLQYLSHCPEVFSLDFSHCRISFGEESQVADLHHVKAMVLEGAQCGSPGSMVASLATAKQLQDLNIRSFHLDRAGDHIPVLQLGRLLSSLQSLQKLDVTSCSHVHLGPSEYTHLRLHSFACHHSQLTIVEDIPFSPISQSVQTGKGSKIWPRLQVQGCLGHQQRWITTLPVTHLTHLTVKYACEWLLPWFLDFEALPNLLYLDVVFHCYQSADQDIRLPAGCTLQELYVRGTGCTIVDLTDCTSLTSLGIHCISGCKVQSLGLPTSLERLCLYNVLRAESHPDHELCLLNNLDYLKVGAEGTKGTMLPKLPPSLLKLDLQDCFLTGLAIDQLTLVTRLKKLGMSSPPTPQQLSIIKQLRQLRHIHMIKGIDTGRTSWGRRLWD